MPPIFSNPHPALSGFPPVILCLLVASEIWSLAAKRPVSGIQSFLLFGLALTLPLTYFSGWWAAGDASAAFAVPDTDIARHQLAAKAFALLLFVPILAFTLERFAKEGSRRALRILFRVGLLASLAAGAYTGYLGGELVFEHGAGITTSPPGRTMSQ